jgi:hypothetical protein
MSINRNKDITMEIIALKLPINFLDKLMVIANMESKKLNLDITVRMLILKVVKDFARGYLEDKNEKM